MRNFQESVVNKRVQEILSDYKKTLPSEDIQEINNRVLSNIKTVSDLSHIEDSIKEIIEEY